MSKVEFGNRIKTTSQAMEENGKGEFMNAFFSQNYRQIYELLSCFER